MRCVSSHATHPDARLALGLALASLRSRWPADVQPTLGLCYFTDVLAPQAEALWAELRQAYPEVGWCGAASVGVLADATEYLDEPALALLLCDLPPTDWALFDGTRPLRATRTFTPDSALVHADPSTPELGELLAELAARTHSGFLFGGLAASRTRSAQLAGALHQGGLSGLGFSARCGLSARVTQGCLPVAPVRRISACDGATVLELDGEPALPRLLADLDIDLAQIGRAMPVLRNTLVGLSDAEDEALDRGGRFEAAVRVRHLVSLEPARRALVLSDAVLPGMQFTLCRRDVDAARHDLTRIATSLRAQAEDEGLRLSGAVYVSCAGRGGPHFGAPHAEAQLLRRALGEVPTVGFFAGGEIAHQHLYGYTGVLTVFAA